jgi:hypothetical protein
MLHYTSPFAESLLWGKIDQYILGDTNILDKLSEHLVGFSLTDQRIKAKESVPISE